MLGHEIVDRIEANGLERPGAAIRRVLLICPGLEPERDGVGDYSYRLAEELAKLGVECAVLALNDHLVGHEVTSEKHQPIRWLRLPSSMPSALRYARAAAFLSEWRPDWVSLQFVSYGFHDRGLPFRELRAMPRLLRGFRVHVMLHELWLGMLPPASPKQRAVGALQRLLILRLLQRLRPCVIHTSNGYSREVLAHAGLRTGIFPLLGPIPLRADADRLWLSKALSAASGVDVTGDRQDIWTFGIFGSIAAHWPVERLFTRLREIAAGGGRRVLVVSVGQAGGAAPELFARWQKQFPEIEFRVLGPRGADEISQFFHAIDFGLSPYPEALLGKSSAATAMLEHGVPVIVSWGGLQSNLSSVEAEFESLIWRDDCALESRLKHPPPRRLQHGRSAAIARSFLSALEQCNSFAIDPAA
jgi:hypothetical protein